MPMCARLLQIVTVLLVLGLAVAADGAGEEARLATGADIITAIDTSSSITNADLALEYAGLAEAPSSSAARPCWPTVSSAT